MVGFAVVSLAAFGVWAFGGRWFHGRGGEVAMYAATAGVFVLLTGLLMHPLVIGANRIRRFYGAFAPAFLAYAILWSALWFWLGFGAGEWIAAFLGSAAFVAITGWRLGSQRDLARAVAVFFVLHTAGYFAGGHAMQFLVSLSQQKPVPFLDKRSLVILAKLSWGLFYGMGFGAGMGYVFAVFQAGGAESHAKARSREEDPEG